VSLESSPDSTRSRIGILRPLGIRDFKLLWLGMSVSMLGDGVFWVALAWQVYRLSDAPTALSIVGIAWTLPMVFFLLGAGLVTDRIERRRVMIFADVVRGCAVGAMGVLSVTGSIELWHLIVLSGVFGVGDAFLGPPSARSCPTLCLGTSSWRQIPLINSSDRFPSLCLDPPSADSRSTPSASVRPFYSMRPHSRSPASCCFGFPLDSTTAEEGLHNVCGRAGRAQRGV
jgi:Transmembrane secretion effector